MLGGRVRSFSLWPLRTLIYGALKPEVQALLGFALSSQAHSTVRARLWEPLFSAVFFFFFLHDSCVCLYICIYIKMYRNLQSDDIKSKCNMILLF